MQFFQLLKKTRASSWVIFLFVLTIPMINTNHHKWANNEGVIVWDVKSYYAYLPAAFIYHDLSLDYLDENPDKFNKWIWPIETPIGKKSILTTMGLSVMYAPFFGIAHLVASISPQFEADGYSLPYHYALAFSTFFYFVLGLFVLRKILLRYFNEGITAFTIFTIAAGTNLFYYISYEACMSHGYNFVLITVFIYFLEKWTDKITLKHTVYLGLLSGLIALIRPTNIIILLLVPFWRVGSWNDFTNRLTLLVKRWQDVLIMAAFFVLVWVPQFVYWKYVSGQFFYFSYGERSDTFFWSNPQIWKILFSYEKGWFVYTPLMLLAIVGLIGLRKRQLKLTIPILLYVSIMIYVLSSWWSWWFGGAFGQRSMVDFYGLMALPLAAFIEYGFRKRILKYITVILIVLLIALNQFNIQQYRNMAISYWWMNKEGYWENFLQLRPTCKYWNVAMHPDYEKARKGIYEPIAPYNKNQVVTDSMLIERIILENNQNTKLIDSIRVNDSDSLLLDSIILNNFARNIVAQQKAGYYFQLIKIDYYVDQINKCSSWREEIENEAKKKKISYEEMALIEANRIYKNYSQKYDQR